MGYTPRMSRSIHVLAIFQAKAGKERDSEGLLRGLIQPTHEEQGCIRYVLYRRGEPPGNFYFFEEGGRNADFRQHFGFSPPPAGWWREGRVFLSFEVWFFFPVFGGKTAQTARKTTSS